MARNLRFICLSVLFCLFSLTALAAGNDGKTFIVASSHRTLPRAMDAASKYLGRYPDMQIYSTESGYFALTIGELAGAFVDDAIRSQIANGHIPADSYKSFGNGFLNLVWQAPPGIRKGDTATINAVELERGWSRNTKKGVQNALLWSGDYTARIDGDFGTGTRQAIKSFQLRSGSFPSGFLTPNEILELERKRKSAVSYLGYEIVRDIDAGIEIGFAKNAFSVRHFKISDTGLFKTYDVVPGMPFAAYTLVSHRSWDGSLEGLYQLLLESWDPNEAGYHVFRNEWFVISADREGVRTYSYVRDFSGENKGFILSWSVEDNNIYSPLAIAMFNSLQSIPGITLEQTESQSSPEPKIAPSTSKPTGVPNTVAQTMPKLSSGTGFYVNESGMIVTNEHVVSHCTTIRVAGERIAKVIAKDEGRDLAILADLSKPSADNFARLSAYPAELNSDVTVVGFPLQGILTGLNVTRGAVSGQYGIGGNPDEIQITAPVQPGNSGGPLVNEAGHVVGVVSSKLNAGFIAGEIGDIPQNVNFAVRGQTLQTFLAQNGVDFSLEIGGEKLSPVEIARLAKSYTVFLECMN